MRLETRKMRVREDGSSKRVYGYGPSLRCISIYLSLLIKLIDLSFQLSAHMVCIPLGTLESRQRTEYVTNVNVTSNWSDRLSIEGKVNTDIFLFPTARSHS